MSTSHKSTRVPLLNALRKAFFLNEESKETGIPVMELLEQKNEQALHRRRFLGDVTKAGVALSAAGLLNGCRRAADLFEEVPPRSTAVSPYKSSQPSIAILGAGMAGLNCACQLKKAGYASTVYEGSSRTGGRMWSEKGVIAPNLVTELGGEFVDTGHKDMLKLCREFNLPLLDTFAPAEAALLRDSFYIDGRFYSEAEVIAAFEPYQKRIAADIRSLPSVMTYQQTNPTFLYLDNLSISAYFDAIGLQGFLRKGLEVAYVTEYGLEAGEQSCINFLFLFSPNTSQGFAIFGSSDERYKVAGGNAQVTAALYNEVKNNVLTGHRLVRINEGLQGYTLTFDKNGSAFSVVAEMVVCALPFSTLTDVDLQVALPQWKRNAIQSLGYGTNSKLFLGFNNRVWRSYGHSGYIFSNADIQTGWDNTQLQPGSAGGFTVYQGGAKGLQLGTGTPQTQAPKFVAQLNAMWPGSATAYTGVAQRMHWPLYPWSKGSYACYKTGQYSTVRGAEIKPVENLFFAGEHCSEYFQGYMNGAAETGRMAAEAVVKAVKAGSRIAAN